MIGEVKAVAAGCIVAASLALTVTSAAPAAARPSEPGVVNYAVLNKGSVGNIVGARLGVESTFTAPFQAYWVDNPVCNNWADIGLPEVYLDPDLAAFNGATAQESPSDMTHFVKQAVGVFATPEAAGRAYHRVVDRTVGCSGQTTAMHLDNGATQVWSFTGGPAGADQADWVKQEVAGAWPATSGVATDRRCFVTTRLRENVLLQAKVCQSGNGGPAVNVLAGAMQNTLGQ
ncbi:sensor domain-containing protein [Mycolicibacterium obuense]|uniref:Sensor domain-containing protein n=1 Tax=Mycolicibacterium obuense TaxID=1807 RepID=A0A4R5X568_9MYCO|nr:sensor domain-containing protein [Mycolicibacterium obuense]TDL05214.1 sensor domain-containing protein [Mycolicibacterium obuense]